MEIEEKKGNRCNPTETPEAHFKAIIFEGKPDLSSVHSEFFVAARQ